MFKPSEFAVGGGLLDDVDVVVKTARIVMFDYNGQQAAQPAIELILEHGGEDATQNWTVGKATDWQPSEDGLQLIAIGRATQINNQSNGAILLKSLVDAGFPEDRISDSINFLEGLEGHVMRVPSPVRKGLAGQKEGSTILTFATITKFPWDKAGAKAKSGAKAGAGKKGGTPAPAATAAPAPATEEGGEETVDSVATGILLEILANAGDAGVKKQELPGIIYKEYATHPQKKDVVQLLFRDDFLKAGPWKYEAGKISLG